MKPQAGFGFAKIVGVDQKLEFGFFDQVFSAGSLTVGCQKQGEHEQGIVPQFAVIDLV